MACQFVKADGENCAMPPGKGRDWCFAHDPLRREEARKARTKGGIKSQEKKQTDALLEKLTLPDMDVSDEASVIRAVQDTINRLRRGEEEPEVARAIGQLLGVALKARAQSDTDDRLKKLEARTAAFEDLTADDMMRIVREGRRAAQHDA